MSKADRIVCRALINTLDAEQLQELAQRDGLDWYLRQVVEGALNPQAEKSPEQQHNRRWVEYLRLMRSGDRRQRCYAREKLQDAFEYIDWKGQKEILKYFLTSVYKKERLWALEAIHDNYSLIGDTADQERQHWHDTILQLWEKYRDKIAARIITLYLPYNTVVENAVALSNNIGYLSVAMRLGEREDFMPDLNRLTPADTLWFYARLERNPSDEEVERLFYQIALECLENDGMPDAESLLSYSRRIALAFFNLERMKRTRIIMEFYDCDRRMREAYRWVKMYNVRYADWIKAHAIEYFPGLQEAAQQALDDMTVRNPALGELVDKLQLTNFRKRD